MAIIRFHRDLANTNFSTRFEGKDKDGKITMIRLVEGTESVYEKDQDEKAKQKSFRTGYPNTVVDGLPYYQAEITDKSVLNMLKHTVYWGGKITEYDPQSDAKAKNQAIRNTADVITQVVRFKDEDIQKYGYVVFRKESMKMIKDVGIEELHNELITYATANPEKMSEIINNNKNTDMVWASLLIATGVLNVSIDNRFVTWGDNDAPIYTTPNGMDVLDGLVDYFQTKEGKEVKKEAGLRLENLTQNKVTKKATEKAQAKADEKADATDEGDKPKTKIIEKKGRFGRMEKVEVPIDYDENEGE